LYLEKLLRLAEVQVKGLQGQDGETRRLYCGNDLTHLESKKLFYDTKKDFRKKHMTDGTMVAFRYI
jgi:hypothetical protein